MVFVPIIIRVRETVSKSLAQNREELEMLGRIEIPPSTSINQICQNNEYRSVLDYLGYVLSRDQQQKSLNTIDAKFYRPFSSNGSINWTYTFIKKCEKTSTARLNCIIGIQFKRTLPEIGKISIVLIATEVLKTIPKILEILK